jgi:hypothetical protein
MEYKETIGQVLIIVVSGRSRSTCLLMEYTITKIAPPSSISQGWRSYLKLRYTPAMPIHELLHTFPKIYNMLGIGSIDGELSLISSESADTDICRYE